MDIIQLIPKVIAENDLMTIIIMGAVCLVVAAIATVKVINRTKRK